MRSLLIHSHDCSNWLKVSLRFISVHIHGLAWILNECKEPRYADKFARNDGLCRVVENREVIQINYSKLCPRAQNFRFCLLCSYIFCEIRHIHNIYFDK